jgi:hypothetical protein
MARNYHISECQKANNERIKELKEKKSSGLQNGTRVCNFNFTYARELAAAAAGCGDPLKLLIVLLLSEPKPKAKAQQLQHI